MSNPIPRDRPTISSTENQVVPQEAPRVAGQAHTKSSKWPGYDFDVTEAMMDAGYELFQRLGIVDQPLLADRAALSDIFLAMLSACPDHLIPEYQAAARAAGRVKTGSSR